MKKVFSNGELCHVWASLSQDEGRGSSMSFNASYPFPYGSERFRGWTGSRIYSYSTIMGAIFTRPDGVQLAIINMHSYSPTTGKHQRNISRAVHNRFDVVCYPVYLERGASSFDIESQSLFNGLVRETLERAAGFVLSSRKRRKEDGRLYDVNMAAGLLDDLQKIADFFGHEYTRPASLDLIAEDIAKARELERLEREAARARIAAEQAEDLKRWLAGEDVRNHFAELKLRIKGEEIQTTHGARVPVDHAREIWPLLARWKAEGKTYTGAVNGRSIRLGVYSVDSFDGLTLKVGCHLIPWGELERMAGLLGLASPEPVAA